MGQNPSSGRQPGRAAREFVFAASFALALAASGPVAAATPPATETVQAVTNCANAGGPINRNPGPGTRGTECEGSVDWGTGGSGHNYGSAGSHLFSSERPFVMVSCDADSYPHPQTGLQPSVSVSGNAAMTSAHKVRARTPGASAPTVRMKVAIDIYGTYTGSSGQSIGRARGGLNGPSNELFDWSEITIPTFGTIEYVDLAPEQFGQPSTGDYLHLALHAGCSDGASVAAPSVLCNANTRVVVSIDPADPNAADYELTSGPNPSAMTLRWPGSITLEWDPVPNATGYDIIRGDLSDLRTSAGDFSLATDACEANMIQLTSITFMPEPNAGAGFWFLGRAETNSGTGSWDSVGAAQTGPRDNRVALSGNDCP